MGVAGRPKGSVTRPQFRSYTTEKQRKEFVDWVLENYKDKPELAKWVGDQIFGKAVQPIGNDDGKPLVVQFDSALSHVFASASKEDSAE